MGNSLLIWVKATRPWSLTASVCPVLLGAAYAFWQTAQFHWGLFLLTLAGGCLLHLGTNMINTYGDFIRGVDVDNHSAPTAPELVNGILKPKAVRNVGLAFFALAVLCGLLLFYFRGWIIILFGIVGLIGGYGYTAGIAYKYKGLGTICVFFLMGPLMVGGAYFVQTATLNLPVFLISLPVACLVASILHSNDMRDLAFDDGAGISTLALALGKEKCVRLSQVLNIAPFFLLVCFVWIGWLPWLCLITLIMLLPLPHLFANARLTVQGIDAARLQMEGLSAKQHFSFCIIYFLTLWIGALFL